MILFWLTIFLVVGFDAAIVISMVVLSRQRRREVKRQAQFWRGVLR